MPDKTMQSAYTTRPLTAGTWGDFAGLVEANNGVWGGCWCMGFHPEGVGKGRTVSQNREAKHAHVREGTVHQLLVYDGGDCAGWCQYGRPAELPAIKNASTHHPAPLGDPPVALESELLEQVLRAGVEPGAALGFPTLDLLGVCLDEPAASLLDRSQGAGHCRPRDPCAAVALSREYAADPPVR